MRYTAVSFLLFVILLLPGFVATAGTCNYDVTTHTCKLQGQAIDPREYVEWGGGKCHAPYDKLLKMGGGNHAMCTAQYVAPNIILTAMHCVADGEPATIKRNTIWFRNCKDESFSASIIEHGSLEQYNKKGGYDWIESSTVDWVLLLVDDSKYYSNAYFDVSDESVMPTEIVDRTPGFWVDNPGWGALAILADAEIADIRAKTLNYIKTKTADEYCKQKRVEENCVSWYLTDFIRSDRQINNLFENDNDKLKVHKHCALWPYLKNSSIGFKGTTHFTYCYSWGGNSGGAYYTPNDTLLRGIVSGGAYSIPKEWVCKALWRQ